VSRPNSFASLISNAAMSRVSHSQITCTAQPSVSSEAIFRRSLDWLARNFCCQNSWRVFGVAAHLQSCLCQKQPWTKIIFRCLGNTRSGRPGRLRACNLKRNPSLCAQERTASSGAVSLPRILLIIRLRVA
jgi:hypothetical protein